VVAIAAGTRIRDISGETAVGNNYRCDDGCFINSGICGGCIVSGMHQWFSRAQRYDVCSSGGMVAFMAIT